MSQAKSPPLARMLLDVTAVCAPASQSLIVFEPWLTLRWDIPIPQHRRYSQHFAYDFVLKVTVIDRL